MDNVYETSTVYNHGPKCKCYTWDGNKMRDLIERDCGYPLISCINLQHIDRDRTHYYTFMLLRVDCVHLHDIYMNSDYIINSRKVVIRSWKKQKHATIYTIWLPNREASLRLTMTTLDKLRNDKESTLYALQRYNDVFTYIKTILHELHK